MSRYLAAFYHLLISFVVFIGLAYLVVFVWYPDFFYTIEGGWQGMRIIIAVDLVLGPMLTLVIFKAGKPGLKFDLACIGLLQGVCLAAGVYVVATERPTHFVFYDGHFYTASSDTFEEYGLMPPETQSLSPVMVIAQLPDDPSEQLNFRKALYDQQIPIWLNVPGYGSLHTNLDRVLAQSFSYQDLTDRDKSDVLAGWLEEHGGTMQDYAFYPVHSRYESPFIAIRKSDRSFVDVVKIPAPLAG